MTCHFRLAAILAALTGGLTLPGVALAAPSGGASKSSPTWSFVSAPDLHPPRVQVLKRKSGIAHGDFLTAANGRPLLLDRRARPVWTTPVNAFDLQQETYKGKPVLVWFEHSHSQTPGVAGEVVIYDEHYRQIATVNAQSPWMTDEHDAWITGGDIWITVNRLIQNENLTPYGGPRHGSVLDVGLQEFQLSTGRLVRTWDALNPGGRPNVPLSASKEPVADGWDAYHLNSVQALANGDLLVSMRNTWTVYLIDPIKDKIIWRLGGKHSTFKLGSGTSFAWQHDARLVHTADEGQGSDVELTLFNDDNGGRIDGQGGRSEHPSRGMILSLNTIAHTARLLRAYRHHPPLLAQILGSMQVLPGGNALVGWGSEPYFSEYSRSGRVLLDARWPGSVRSYRVLFTNTWVGTPYYPPSGAARGRTVYASWNGATQVAKWEVLAGSSATNLKVVARAARTGFETAIKLSHTYLDYEVTALDATGTPLGTSHSFS